MSILGLLTKSKDIQEIETKVSKIQPASFTDNLWQNWGHFTEEDDEELDFIDQYKEAVWVYACVQAIAISLSNLPINVFRIKNKQNTPNSRASITRLIAKYGSIQKLDAKLIKYGRRKVLGPEMMYTKIEDIEEVEDSPLVTLLENPNPHTTKADYWERETLHLELRGNSFWEFVGSKENSFISESNPPIEMHLLNPDNVLIVPDKKEYLRGFLYEINGHHIPFEPDEVNHRKYIDPGEEYYGMTAIEAMTDTLKMERRLLKYNQAFFKNQARPDGVLTTEQKLNDRVFDRVRQQWEEKYKGIRNAHKVAILEQGLDFKNIAISQKEADFIETRKMNRQDILAAYKVPPIIVGLETINRATAEVQERIFWENNIKPKAMKRDTAYNSRVAVLFGQDLFIETDFSDISALQADRSEEFKRKIESGQMTPNEARQEDNRELSTDPGADSLYLNPNLIPIADIGASQDVDENDDNEDDISKTFTNDIIKMIDGVNYG